MNRLLLPSLVSGLWIMASSSAEAIVDANANGMSDIWEKKYNGGQLFPSSAGGWNGYGDPDGDGWTNLREAAAGTDPFNSEAPVGMVVPRIAHIPGTYEQEVAAVDASPDSAPEDPSAPGATGAPGLPPVVIDPPVFTLTWPTLPGKTYRADVSENLLSWVPASGTFLGDGDALSHESSNVYSDGGIPDKLFWRIGISDIDSDGDGLSDWEEHQLGTNPQNRDSDGDAMEDGSEYLNGGDPLANAILALWEADAVDPAASPLFASFNFTPQTVGNFPSPTRVLDISGNARHATARTALKNPPSATAPALNNPEGIAGDGFHSKGQNHFSFDPQSPAVNFTGVRSLSFWCRTDLAAIAAAPQPIFSYVPNQAARTNQAVNLNSYVIRAFLSKTATGHEITFRSWDNAAEVRERWTLTTHPRDLNGKWANLTFAWQAGGSGQGAFWALYVNGVKQFRTIGTVKSFLHTPGGPQETFLIGADAGNGTGANPLVTSSFAGVFDRVRLYTTLLTQQQIDSIITQDTDGDGLRDTTESITRVWRDHNNDNIHQKNESTFQSDPSRWQNPATDADDDGVSDLNEQNLHGTDIGNPDSDGDLLPDGWEAAHGLDPLSDTGANGRDGANGDPDGDGLVNLDEYRYNTKPTQLPGDPPVPQPGSSHDSDGDGKAEGAEIGQGSHPGDSSDGGLPLPPAEKISILLGIGDRSGSESEDYSLNVFRIDPATGQEKRFYTLRSGGHGEYEAVPRHFFRKDTTYTFQIKWNSSKFTHRPAAVATSTKPAVTAEGPDFDYTFKVEPQGSHQGALVDSWNPKNGTSDPSKPLLAEDASDVAEDPGEFRRKYESRRVALIFPKLKWEAIEGFENLDTHTDPWANAAKGKRIFPCRKNPNDRALRHKLKLVATGGLKGVELFVKAFDIDDSTSEAFDVGTNGQNPVIDTNGKAGDDNLPDHLETAKSGHFWHEGRWGTNTAKKTFDAQGKASFDFRVGMQPGSNYRAAASVGSAAGYQDVQIQNPQESTYLGPEVAQNGGAIASDPLTVWRRLWVENDSMAAIGTHEFGYKKNDLSWDLGNNNKIIGSGEVNSDGTNTTFLVPNISDVSSFKDLQNGRIILQSVAHPVLESLITYVQMNDISTPRFLITVPGNLSSTPANSGFRLYDDDDFGLTGPPLPQNDLVNGQMKNYFRSSFIEVTDPGAYNSRQFVPFRINEDVSTNLYGFTSTVVADARDIPDSNSLWVAPLTTAYQGPQDADKDPSGVGEGLRQGESASYGGRDHSTVFVEGCRETYDDQLRSQNPQTVANNLGHLKKWIIATAAHEIAHQPGDQTEDEDHAERGLMSEAMAEVITTAPENAKFTATTSLRLRRSRRWSQ